MFILQEKKPAEVRNSKRHYCIQLMVLLKSINQANCINTVLRPFAPVILTTTREKFKLRLPLTIDDFARMSIK